MINNDGEPTVMVDRMARGVCVECGVAMVPLQWRDGRGRAWPIRTDRARMHEPITLEVECGRDKYHQRYQLQPGTRAWRALEARGYQCATTMSVMVYLRRFQWTEGRRL